MSTFTEKQAEEFHKKYGNSKVRKTIPSDSIDMEIWDKDGFSSIKNSARVITQDKRERVYEADTIGDVIKR